MQISYCTFRVGRTRLGIEVEKVQEVIRQQTMTRVPGATAGIRGLMNLRGQIVTALDLQGQLSLTHDPTAPPMMNVVVRSKDGPVSILVHEIGDVLVVDSDLFEPPPETLQETLRQLIKGAFKLDVGLLLVLDAEQALTVAA